MQTIARLNALLLCSTLAVFAGSTLAQSLEDATTKMDEAAEAAAKDAEAEAQAQVDKLKKQEEQGKEMTEEEVSGD